MKELIDSGLNNITIFKVNENNCLQKIFFIFYHEIITMLSLSICGISLMQLEFTKRLADLEPHPLGGVSLLQIVLSTGWCFDSNNHHSAEILVLHRISDGII